MAERYCNICKKEKPLSEFKKYGTECSTCKRERNEKQRQCFYSNRYRCECGLYISDGNPKEKHEKTKAHQNYLKYGMRAPEGLDFLERTGRFFERSRCLEGIHNNYKINNITHPIFNPDQS